MIFAIEVIAQPDFAMVSPTFPNVIEPHRESPCSQVVYSAFALTTRGDAKQERNNTNASIIENSFLLFIILTKINKGYNLVT